MVLGKGALVRQGTQEPMNDLPSPSRYSSSITCQSISDSRPHKSTTLGGNTSSYTSSLKSRHLSSMPLQNLAGTPSSHACALDKWDSGV